VCFDLLPAQPVLLRGFDRGVAQALGLVPGEQQLDRGKERLDELRFLIVEVLSDAFADGYSRALQLQHRDGDAVQVEDEVGPLGVLAQDRHFFRDGEVVLLRVRPIDEPHCFGLRSGSRRDFHSVAEAAVHFPVRVVERLASSGGGGLPEVEQRSLDDLGLYLTTREPPAKGALFDIAVAVALLPVAQDFVAQGVLEELDYSTLGAEFGFADRTHRAGSSSGPRPGRGWRVPGKRRCRCRSDTGLVASDAFARIIPVSRQECRVPTRLYPGRSIGTSAGNCSGGRERSEPAVVR